MKIRKTYKCATRDGKILNSKSDSQNDTYSCDYINKKANTYTTDEQIIGTWVNGKPIYRKVIFTKTGTAKTDTIVGEVPNDRETIVNLTAIVVNSVAAILTIPFYFGTENYGGIWVDYNTRKINCLVTNGAYANKDLAIYVEYTKSTD